VRTEIRTFEVTCDQCKASAIVYSKRSPCDLPNGWDTEIVHNCGLTNYDKEIDLCEMCLVLAGKKISE